MKIRFALITVVSAAMFFASCGGPQGERAATGEAKDAKKGEGLVYQADVESSKITWIGTKPTGAHDGTIAISGGQVMVNNGRITGGEMVIDMNSIVVLDLTDPATNERLRGHLLSADFFEVETYPEARFVFTSVEEYTGEQTGNIEFTHTVSGNLTMKDATRNVSFPARVEIKDGAIKAVSDKFIIDRSEWNVRYGSRRFFDNLRDNFIHDDIVLEIHFHAKS